MYAFSDTELDAGDGAKDNPTLSLSSRDLVQNLVSALADMGSEILNRLIVYCCDKWLEEK